MHAMRGALVAGSEELYLGKCINETTGSGMCVNNRHKKIFYTLCVEH